MFVDETACCMLQTCINKCIIYKDESITCPVCEQRRYLNEERKQPRRTLVVYRNALQQRDMNQRSVSLHFDEGFVIDWMFAMSKTVKSLIDMVNNRFSLVPGLNGHGRPFISYSATVNTFLEAVVILDTDSSEETFFFHEICDVIKKCAL